MKKLSMGFALAVSMLSTLPFFRVHDFFKGINGYAVMFYPIVGALLGGILLGVYWLLHPYIPETHLKVMLFFLWILLTGGLHLDGFSDTVDGLFVPAERAEEVMKDPHTGGMGMLFTGGFLLLKASALWHLEALWALPLLLLLARYNAVLAICCYPYIRNAGMGSLAKAELTRSQVIVATLLVVPAALLAPQGWSLLLGAVVTLLFVARFVAKRLGGFSGDLYGFLIEVSELVLLHLLIVGAAL